MIDMPSVSENEFVCIDCGTVYRFRCIAEKCPYIKKGRRIGLCIICNKEGVFDTCEYLRIEKVGG